MSELERLLLDGADPNSMDHNNTSLLMIFAKQGDTQAVDLLLKFGARADHKDLFGLTALDYAIEGKHIQVAKILVDNGATISNDNYMYAVKTNNKELVDFFDEHDPNKKIFLKRF